MSSNGEERVRVIVCDDDPLARRVIRSALEGSGIIVIAEAPGGREAIELALHYRPEVLITDMMMPGIDGLETTRKVVAAAPEIQVLVLTVSENHELGMAALRAGATGYLSKDVRPQVLAEHVRRIAAGNAAVCDELLGSIIDRLRSLPQGGLGIRPVRSELTSREWEVLDMLCAGASVDVIAEEFVLSAETVRSHVKSILRKLGVHSQREAVAAATELRSSLGAVADPV